MTFKITDHVEFDGKNRAVCPSCATDGKTKKKNLALLENGAYKCHRGCRPEDIRNALGNPKTRTTPTALQPKVPPAKAQINPQKVKAAHKRLVESDGPAKKWLIARGIDEAIIQRHKLGISRVRVDQRSGWAISIPIPNDDGTAYYLKKRVAPWDESTQQLAGYQPWKQYGVPQRVWFTHKPEGATETYLCEGEWDAMKLAAIVRESDRPIAVACFTCGCSNVPPAEQLDKLPGQVRIFYDRNDTPLKSGIIPGEAGAETAALQIGDRAAISKVPMPENCTVKGWDVSDALNRGYTLDDFIKAAAAATKPHLKASSSNPLMQRLKWNDDLIDNAPDYTEWLVPDLLTEDELFLLAASPRAGKSLMAMTLAKAVAAGEPFMGRPTTQGTVMYVKCEDSDTKIKEREKAQEWSRGLPVAWFDSFKLSEMNHLEEVIRELDPRLLVLDTLSRIKEAGISESSAEMSQLLEPLQTLANKYGCCILLVHHTGKVNLDNAKQIDIFDTIRGSSAIRAVCRGSMVLAAGERDYRLVVENGWGKHDLKVVLDANTLTWKQLGTWAPTVNGSQQEQIVTALKKLGQASIEQLHEETGIPQNSLYVQLSRLSNSEDPDLKVAKEGKRRNYTYRLALFNAIQQLNSVLNRPNSNSESDKGPIQQKSFFSGNSGSDKISTTSDVPVEKLKSENLRLPPTNAESVKYPTSTSLTEKDSAYLTDNKHYLTTDKFRHLSQDVNLSNAVTVESDGGEKVETVTFSKGLVSGALVRYTGRDQFRVNLCRDKLLTVVAEEVQGYIVCDHDEWINTQSIPAKHLNLDK